MTQQHAAVATARGQLPATDVSTGVGGQPGVQGGVPLLATEAAILCWHLGRQVRGSTLGASPAVLFRAFATVFPAQCLECFTGTGFVHTGTPCLV